MVRVCAGSPAQPRRQKVGDVRCVEALQSLFTNQARMFAGAGYTTIFCDSSTKDGIAAAQFALGIAMTVDFVAQSGTGVSAVLAFPLQYAEASRDWKWPRHRNSLRQRMDGSSS